MIGKTNKVNSNVHLDSLPGKIGIVHNGIIENFEELKKELPEGFDFKSETDSGIIANLLQKHYEKTKDVKKTILKTISEIIPIHLLSYYAALEKDTDPEYPRNLAKSVTVK